MIKVFTKQNLMCLLVSCLALTSFAQKTSISGQIRDATSKESLAGVTLNVKNTPDRSQTDAKGQFVLETSAGYPLTLIISAVGYDPQEELVSTAGELDILLSANVNTLDQIVVTASRTEERALRSPVTVEKMDATAVRQVSALHYFDATANLKGMDMVTSGLTYKVINTRGFNDTGNARFLQLIDGMDNQSAGLGFTPGNLFGPSDLDVESVELIPGSASALWGPVAFNGLLHTKTKNPWDYQGLSVQTKLGVNHLNDSRGGAQPLYEISARYATAWNDRLALKINASYFAGKDWYAQDYTDVNPNTPEALKGPNNPARNALNIYGDEVVGTLDSIGQVSRTGYEEYDLANYDVYSVRVNAALHYRITKGLELIGACNYNQGTANYTGSSRYVLNNFAFTQPRVELRGKNFFVRAYASSENSNDSYSTRNLGQKLNRTWVRDLNGNVVPEDQADDTWFLRYRTAFSGDISGVNGGDHQAARAFADQGRYLPGSADFDREKERLIATPGLPGAGILSKSKLYHVDVQYNLSSLVRVFDLQAGGNFRRYDMNTGGTLFDDKDGGVTNNEYGAFVQASKSLIDNKLRLVGSVRYDKNESFEGRFTPRISAVVSPVDNHHFRLSYQSGFRNPTMGDQYISLNVGPIVILGGAPDNSRGWNAYENSVTAASVGAFFQGFQQSLAQGVPFPDAVFANKDKFVKSDVPFIKPERNQTYEIGYKALVNDVFSWDINYYYSQYTDFIINQVVIRPNNADVLGPDGTINPAVAEDFLNNDVLAFQLYTNAADKVSTQGATLGIQYQLPKGYRIGANTTWSDFNIQDANPNNIPAFNTPRWKANLSLSNARVTDRIGFQVSWRWQEAFDWYGTLNELRPGTVEAYHWLDAQVSYRLPRIKTTLKVGANNLTNQYIVQAYGSPAVGGVYYLSMTYGL
ncbi:MAG TPA: TonB-dependent receptor [Saprospiraceae bacterium]|nr:TonB-dependent receptor [Saprospiraceae bacterium]